MLRRAPLAVVGAQAMGEPVDQPPRPLGAGGVAERWRALRMNRSNKRTGSGLDHSPCAQALYQPTEPEAASRTSARQLARWTIATGPSPAPAERAEAAVGQGRVDPPFSDAGVDPLEQFVEAAGEQARDEPAAGREPAVRRDQMFAPLQHRRSCAQMRAASSVASGASSHDGSDLVRLLLDLPGLALGDQRLEVGAACPAAACCVLLDAPRFRRSGADRRRCTPSAIGKAPNGISTSMCATALVARDRGRSRRPPASRRRPRRRP